MVVLGLGGRSGARWSFWGLVVVLGLGGRSGTAPRESEKLSKRNFLKLEL